MRLEDLAQHATDTMHDSVASVDTLQRLEQVPRRVRAGRRRTAAALALVAAMVIAGATWAATSPRQSDMSPSDDRRGTEQPLLRTGTIIFDVPMKYPSSDLFVSTTRSRPGQGSVTFYQLDGHSGLSIFEHARPIRSNGITETDPSGGTTALEMARWISKRPFVATTSTTSTTVGGRPAVRVIATLKPGARLTTNWDWGRIAPLLFDVAPAGSWVSRRTVGEMTLLDTPGAGVAAIWSWNDTGNLKAATDDAVRAFIEQLSFG